MWDLATIIALNEKAHQEYLERKRREQAEEQDENPDKTKVKIA